ALACTGWPSSCSSSAQKSPSGGHQRCSELRTIVAPSAKAARVRAGSTRSSIQVLPVRARRVNDDGGRTSPSRASRTAGRRSPPPVSWASTSATDRRSVNGPERHRWGARPKASARKAPASPTQRPRALVGGRAVTGGRRSGVGAVGVAAVGAVVVGVRAVVVGVRAVGVAAVGGVVVALGLRRGDQLGADVL